MLRNVRVVVILLVFFLSAGCGVWWLQRYKQKTKAKAAPPRLFFSIPAAMVEGGSNFEVYVNINPNSSPFYSFDLQFSYDPTKINFVDEVNPASNISMIDSSVISYPSVDVLTHIITIKGTRTASPFIGGEPIQIAKIAFVMKPETALPLQFSWDANTVIAGQSAISKEDLTYVGGVTPTVSVSAASAPTLLDKAGALAPTLTPSVTASSKAIGTTTAISSRADKLYINSIVANPSPFRYEQNVVLDKGTYALTIGAKVHYSRGRGMFIAIHCNENDCGGGKKRNGIIVRTPVFPVKPDFSEMQTSVTIPNEGNGKNYLVRVYCEDGSECELDYVTLEDAWGSEKIVNAQFANAQMYTDPRRQPSSWEIDSTATLFGSVDLSAGENGALVINNSTQ